MKREGMYGVLVVCLSASALLAGAYDPVSEMLVTSWTDDFGAQGSGVMAGTGLGWEPRGGWCYPPPNVVRFYDGEAGGTQAAGSFDIALKKGGTVDYYDEVTHVTTNKAPAVGGALHGGGTFDGTSLWLVTGGLFQLGQAPPVGTVNVAGTSWDGSSKTVATGADLNPARPSKLAQTPVVQGTDTVPAPPTTKTWYVAADLYMPLHDEVGSFTYRIGAGPYAERDWYGLKGLGGMGTAMVTLTPDAWHKMEIRMAVTTNGNLADAAPIPNDDTATAITTYFVDGVQVAEISETLSTTWMQGRPNTMPVNIGPAFAFQRPVQGFPPEAFIDNVTLAEIVAAPVPIPEPATLALLLAGGIGVLIRRRKVRSQHVFSSTQNRRRETMKREGICSVLVVCLSAGAVLAGPLNPGEVLDPPLYTLTFGTQGAGTDALAGTGVQLHGAWAYPPGASLRFYDGAAGGSQETGDFDLAFKNGGGVENISDIVPNRVPAVGSALSGGGSFDGTALWVHHSRFNPGGTPPIGSASAPTLGTSPVKTADGGTDVRTDNANLILVPVVTGTVTQQSYLLSAQLYMPSHANDLDTTASHGFGFGVGPYLDRQAFGLQSIGGAGGLKKTASADTWHLLEVRVDMTTDGGALADPSDDSGSAVATYYIDGVQSGGVNNITLDPTWMQKPFQTGQPVRLGFFTGLQRGWQGTPPESFFDNITASQIVEEAAPIPEPATLGLLTLGVLSVLRRRRRG